MWFNQDPHIVDAVCVEKASLFVSGGSHNEIRDGKRKAKSVSHVLAVASRQRWRG